MAETNQRKRPTSEKMKRFVEKRLHRPVRPRTKALLAMAPACPSAVLTYGHLFGADDTNAAAIPHGGVTMDLEAFAHGLPSPGRNYAEKLQNRRIGWPIHS
jgi:hypothetical protein